jgi:hypothetical protein
MRSTYPTLLKLACLGLATLAVLPHTETIRQEWNYLHQTWAMVRSSEPIQPVQRSTAATEPNRNRSVLQPDAPTPGKTSASAHTNQDPFLTEARRRAQDDPEAAMAWIQTQAIGPERLRGMLEVVALWAAHDSPNALLWLESNAQGIARLETINSGMELWGQQDPAAAADWIDGMANDGSKVTATKALAANWVMTDTDGVTRWLTELPAGIARDQAASAMVDSWTAIDPEAATVWALMESESSGNHALLAQSIRAYAAADPKRAEIFLREFSGASDAPGAVETYVEALTRQDPAAATAWLATLPADDPLYNADHARILIQEWSQTDSVAASAWLSEQDQGPERDAAIVGFADTMLTFEPGVVAAWANSVSDPKTRLQLLDLSIVDWAKADPIQALEWVKTADIEPSLRDALAREIGAD